MAETSAENLSGARAPGVLDDWIPQADLAAQLGIHVDTLQRWTRERTGPSFMKIGRAVYYHRDSVKEWLLSREIKFGKRSR